MCGHNDIYLNGECKSCDREAQAKYRKRRKLGMALLHAAEARSLSGEEAIRLLQYAGPDVIQQCVNVPVEAYWRRFDRTVGE